MLELKVEIEQHKEVAGLLRREREGSDNRIKDAVKASAEKTERACKSQSALELAGVKVSCCLADVNKYGRRSLLGRCDVWSAYRESSTPQPQVDPKRRLADRPPKIL